MIKKILVSAIVALGAYAPHAHAIDLSSILGSAGSAAQGLVEGLFTQTDITVDQMVGTWTATGSAVTFQSDNALKKAGGNAASGTIESKLDPYYQKYGLTGSTLTVNADGTFTLKVKSLSIKGTITKRSDGNFDFTFTPFGNIKLGTIKTYVEKPVGGLNVMFDASKLKSLVSAVAGFTGNSLAKTASSVLDGYDGMLVGFKYKGSGSSTSSGSSSGTTSSDAIKDALKGILNK